MSMDRCTRCGDLVDTDDDPEAYVQLWKIHRWEDFCYCERCREEKQLGEFAPPEDDDADERMGNGQG